MTFKHAKSPIKANTVPTTEISCLVTCSINITELSVKLVTLQSEILRNNTQQRLDLKAIQLRLPSISTTSCTETHNQYNQRFSQLVLIAGDLKNGNKLLSLHITIWYGNSTCTRRWTDTSTLCSSLSGRSRWGISEILRASGVSFRSLVQTDWFGDVDVFKFIELDFLYDIDQ